MRIPKEKSRIMATVAALSFFLIIGNLFQGSLSQSCQSSGFAGCDYNILGAFGVAGLDNKFTGYAPDGVEKFAYSTPTGGTPNLAYLCEANTVTILYDCNAKVPLYAATMMTGNQLNTVAYQRTGTFRSSGDSVLNKQFQPQKADYAKSNSRTMCYESIPAVNGQNYLIDGNWYSKKYPGQMQNGPCPNLQAPLKSPVAIGHLIAASYGRGSVNNNRIKATFTYTNSIPQFAAFNSGKWLQAEKYLIIWGQQHCAKAPNTNVEMYIVVGAIPSTFSNLTPRFFGESGFSNFQGPSGRTGTFLPNQGKKNYRVNVPSYMWTAACCTFKYKDATGQWQDGTDSTAFYRANNPGSDNCKFFRTPSQMFLDFQRRIPGIVTLPNIFPQNSNC